MNLDVLVLHNQPLLPDGHPEAESEREILETAEHACAALAGAEFRVERLAVGRDLGPLLGALRRRPDVVVNLFEGLASAEDAGSEAAVAALLEWHGLPFTGSPAPTIALTRSKPLSKFVLHGAGLPTPDFMVLDGLPEGPLGLGSCLGRGTLRWPVIVKPAHQDASAGIDQGSVVTRRDSLRKRVALLLERFGPPVLVEQYVEGRELTVAVVEVPELQALPVSEFVFKPRAGAWPIVTYDAKWRVGSRDFQHTPFCERAVVTPELERRLHELAVRAYRVLGLRDYGRVDFRVTDAGEPFILEVNANPDLSPQAALADGLIAAGTSHAEFVARLVRHALDRASDRPVVAGGR